MKILAIETSCDETAVAVLACTGDEHGAQFTVLGNALLSQIDIHREFGGVFPAVAKREHAKNLVPLLAASLEEAELMREGAQAIPADIHEQITSLLGAREPELLAALLPFLSETETPDIDAIAVTAGPGLAPALWVGVNFAKALSLTWNKPVVSVNHMEGHILSSLVRTDDNQYFKFPEPKLPLLALLISGGHTELVIMKKWLEYELIGQTRDDAVGEAFDKVARMMGLPYPGGPEISRLAEKDREDTRTNPFTLPRPMIDSPDLDFSFSGLKTAALYQLKARAELSDIEREQFARAVQESITDVLYKKTVRGIEQTGAQSLAIGGGVSADTHIRRVFAEEIPKECPGTTVHIPIRFITGDNALMIGIAGYFRALRQDFTDRDALIADGNRTLT